MCAWILICSVYCSIGYSLQVHLHYCLRLLRVTASSIIILTVKKTEKVKTPINYASARVVFLLPRKIHLCKNHLFQIINNCRESIKSIQPLLFLECLGWQGRYLPFKVNVSRKKNKLYRKIIFYMIFWNQLGLKFWKNLQELYFLCYRNILYRIFFRQEVFH